MYRSTIKFPSPERIIRYLAWLCWFLIIDDHGNSQVRSTWSVKPVRFNSFGQYRNLDFYLILHFTFCIVQNFAWYNTKHEISYGISYYRILSERSKKRLRRRKQPTKGTYYYTVDRSNPWVYYFQTSREPVVLKENNRTTRRTNVASPENIWHFEDWLMQ